MGKKRKTKTSIRRAKETKIVTIKTQILKKISKPTQCCCKPLSNPNEKRITVTNQSLERNPKQSRAIKSEEIEMQTL